MVGCTVSRIKMVPMVVHPHRSVDSSTVFTCAPGRPAAVDACRLNEMSARVPTVSLILIALGALLSFSMQRSQERSARQAMQAWASAYVHWSNRSPSDKPPSPYWRWRALMRDGRMEELGRATPFEFLQMGAGQEVWAVNEAAQVSIQQVPAEAIPLISVSTASFLGAQLPDDPVAFGLASQRVIGGLSPWRQRLSDACGTCAPPAQPFPSSTAYRVAGSQGINARGAIGVSIGVEQYRRSAVPIPASASPMIAMVQRIRNGGLPTDAEWQMPGLSGMAALELALRGDASLAPQFLNLGRTGPSRSDKIAGLWAARQVGATDSMLSAIELGRL